MDDTTSDSCHFKAMVLMMLNIHVLLVKLYSLKIIHSHCACNCNSKELYSISIGNTEMF